MSTQELEANFGAAPTQKGREIEGNATFSVILDEEKLEGLRVGLGVLESHGIGNFEREEKERENGQTEVTVSAHPDVIDYGETMARIFQLQRPIDEIREIWGTALQGMTQENPYLRRLFLSRFQTTLQSL